MVWGMIWPTKPFLKILRGSCLLSRWSSKDSLRSPKIKSPPLNWSPYLFLYSLHRDDSLALQEASMAQSECCYHHHCSILLALLHRTTEKGREREKSRACLLVNLFVSRHHAGCKGTVDNEFCPSSTGNSQTSYRKRHTHVVTKAQSVLWGECEGHN